MRLILFSLILFISTAIQALEFKSPFSQSQPTFLPVNQAFQLSVNNNEMGQVVAHWDIADGYYLYQHQFSIKAKTLDLHFEAFPVGVSTTDAYFGDVTVYRNQVSIIINTPNNTPSNQIIEATIGFQGCADAGLCYPPQKEPVVFESQPLTDSRATNHATVASKFKPSNELSSAFGIQERLTDASWLMAAITLFGLGLLLSFTPCVLPMIPIVSAMVVGTRNTPWKGFYFSVLYVLGMATTYAMIGALVGFFGLSLNLQAFAQSPLILAITAFIFVLLAAFMFGLIQVTLPTKLQYFLNQLSDRASNKHSSITVFASGILATLVVSPCVSAPLAGVLLYISTQGETLYGATMLWFMALGMGVPLLLVGLFGPKILPKSGAWLEDIKSVMGFALLGMAIWLITRWLPVVFHLYLWALLSLSFGTYFIHQYINGNAHFVRLWLAAMSFFATLLLLTNGPLVDRKFFAFDPSSDVNATAQNQSQVKTTSLDFTTITSLDALTSLIQSQKGDAPILLDFYADWCISCKVIEAELFHHPEIQPLMEKMHLIRLDVTANSDKSQALLTEFNVFGPPSILFLNNNGELQESLSLIGEPSFQALKERLEWLKP